MSIINTVSKWFKYKAEQSYHYALNKSDEEGYGSYSYYMREFDRYESLSQQYEVAELAVESITIE